jgi:hypothetical protein
MVVGEHFIHYTHCGLTFKMKIQQQKEIKKKQQSDLSRHVGLGGGKKQEGGNNSATTFTFCKNLLRNVSLFAQRKLITQDEVLLFFLLPFPHKLHLSLFLIFDCTVVNLEIID